MSRSTTIVTAFLALLALPGAAAAQNECAAYSGQAANVCNAAVDGTRLFHPVVGLLVSGGNPVIGTAKALGGLGHFSITARVNATKVKLPDLNYDGSSSTVGLEQSLRHGTLAWLCAFFSAPSSSASSAAFMPG